MSFTLLTPGIYGSGRVGNTLPLTSSKYSQDRSTPTKTEASVASQTGHGFPVVGLSAVARV